MKYGNLYFQEKTGNYYYTGIEPCFVCHKLIENVIVICKGYTKKEKRIAYSCANCIKGLTSVNNFVYDEKIMALMPDKVPKDAMPIFDSSPTLSNFNGSTVISDARSVQGERIVDRTNQCHNPSFGIQHDAKSKISIGFDLSEKDRLLLPDEATRYLDSLKEATPLDSRFELEDKKEEKKRLKI